MDKANRVVGIYHSRDLDGMCSGAILRSKYPGIVLFGYDYGEDFTPIMMQLQDGDFVVMVDVSLPFAPEEGMFCMEDVANKVGHDNFIFIDHHVSAIKQYKQYKASRGTADYYMAAFPPEDQVQAACEVLWNYLWPKRSLPFCVHLLSEYDTWQNKNKTDWENVILPFQYGMREIVSSAEDFPLGMLTSDHDVPKIVEQGKLILSYQSKQYAKAAKAAFETEFQGMKVIALNGSGFSSAAFDSIWDEEKYDAMMPFVYSGNGFWTISMYTTKDIDLSVIARKMGGGGHAKACGFQVSKITEIFPNL